MKPGRLLVGGGEGQQGSVLVKAAEEGKAHRGSGPADAVVVAGIDARRWWCILASETVGDDYRGMACEVGKNELSIRR